MTSAGEKPLISVITICRNSARTIARTIDSVLKQKNEVSIEYIVIDGASSDGTQEIVRSYGEQISKFISEPDDGISDAFNKGIRLACGEIIAIINSDDRLADGSLRRVLSYFLQNPNVDVIHGDILLYENGRLLKRVRPPKYWWIPWRLIVINHPATFVRRRVYDAHGTYNTSCSYAMDVEIYLRWKNNGCVMQYLPEAFALMGAGGVSYQNVWVGFAESRRVMIQNGHSWMLASLQYLARFGVQLIIECQRRWMLINRKE